MAKNFEGLKVLDLSRVYVGPYLTMMMCDMGADVIKVENPFMGADERALGPYFKNESTGKSNSSYHMAFNRGKKSIVLNMKEAKDVAVIHELAKQADVVVENFRPGVAKKLKCDYELISKLNPSIIYCSVTTYGQEGPMARKPGYDIIAQATSGLMWMTGPADGAPVRNGTSIGDVNAAAHALGAIGAALYYREKTGEGQHIDISMRDCLSAILETAVGRYIHSKGEDKPKRSGNYHPVMMPYGVFDAGDDRYVVLASLAEHQWEKLCKVMGKSEWGAQEKFNNSTNRGINQAELIKVVEDWLKSLSDSDLKKELKVLDEIGVPNTKVYTIEDLVNDPQYQLRNNLVTVDDPIIGPVTCTTTPMLFNKTSVWNDVPAPTLGGNTSEVLRKLTSLSEEEIQEIVSRNGGE